MRLTRVGFFASLAALVPGLPSRNIQPMAPQPSLPMNLGPGLFLVDTRGNVTMSPNLNTVSRLVRITAPADYEAQTPGPGPLLELGDTDLGVQMFTFDVNGNFTMLQPAEHAGHVIGIYGRNENGTALFQIDTSPPASRLILFKTDGSFWHHFGDTIGLFGVEPAPQQAHISDPVGGATQDAEARSAIASILNALEAYGLLAGA
jgi:hypothetical protein